MTNQYTARRVAKPARSAFGTFGWEVVEIETGRIVVTTNSRADAHQTAANLNAGLTVNGEPR